MLRRRLLLLALASVPVLLVLMGAGVLSFPSADALPPAGLDVFNVTAQVEVKTRLGSETVSFEGTATIQRADPHMDGGVEVAALELTSMVLQGESTVGTIVVAENPTVVSPGELRSLQPSSQFPASAFINAFINVTVPANPSPTQLLHNDLALRLLPMSGGEETDLDSWPPVGVTFGLEPIFGVDNDGDTQIDEDTADEDGDGLVDEDRPGLDPVARCNLNPSNADCDDQEGEDPPPNLCPPATDGTPTLCDPDGDGLIDEDPDCVPLLGPDGSHMPLGVCIRNVTIVIGAPKTPTPGPTPGSLEGQTLSVAPNGPSGLHPAALLELAQGGAGPVQVSGNDNFANAWPITGLPFTGLQNTSMKTTEPGEPVAYSAASCQAIADVAKGRTAWYRYTAPASTTVTFDTDGSFVSYDTVIAVYTGSTLNALTLVGCDDDNGPGFLSSLTIPVAAGTTYQIQVGGFNASSGDLHFNVSGPGGAGEAGPTVRVTCQRLGLTADGCDLGLDGDQDDLDALSYGVNFIPNSVAYGFSVTPGSSGSPGSAVAQQAACSPPQAQADEFTSALNATNALLFDGDGAGPACPTAEGIGFLEIPASDDLDAINSEPPSFVDTNGDGALDRTVYFSLATGSPSLVTLGRNAADILWTTGGTPGVYASSNLLGLRFGDDLDAMCIVDRGTPNVYEAGVDTVLFSLAAGSPTLADFGLSAADILRPGPQLAHPASLLGLRAADDLDALTCYEFAAPPTPTPGGPTPTPAGQMGDANCSGTVNSIDAALVLQRTAGLVGSLPCAQLADVNEDGRINSLDAALILQLIAGLIPDLPP